MKVNEKKLSAFQKSVITYWKANGRHELPWRKTRDPYKILVSEIMLQQTQVDRVVPFFERFIVRFPTIQSLAEAPLSEVLKEWQGLGYNRRAKLLRECAKVVEEKHSGKVPKDLAALVDLPGIGPYTAGAIRAFAFNESGIFIETNIRAALIHYFFPRSQKVPDSKLTPILELYIPGMYMYNMKKGKSKYMLEPRDWYAALMDYGTHIKKTNPNPSRRSKHHTKQSKFEGSLRQMRGRILRALLVSQKSDSVLKADVKGFVNPSHFEKAIQALETEGMIIKKRNKWSLAS